MVAHKKHPIMNSIDEKANLYCFIKLYINVFGLKKIFFKSKIYIHDKMHACNKI